MNRNLKRISILFILFFAFFLVHNVYGANYMTVNESRPFNQVGAYEVLSLVNQQRQANGKAPLVWDGDLEAVAMQRAIEADGFFAHTRPSGEDCYTAFNMIQNNSYYVKGENIYWAIGYPNVAASAMNSWMNSDGHRANILNDSFTSIGVANCGTTWVQVFGATSNTSNQSHTDFQGNKSYDIVVKDPIIQSNLDSVEFSYGESYDNFFNTNSKTRGNAIIFYVTTTDTDLAYQSIYYDFSINKYDVTMESSNPNALQVNGRGLTARDAGTGTLTFRYQNAVPYTINFKVLGPDMTNYLFNAQYYADKNPDLKAAYGYDAGALKNHYEVFGKAEGRQASPVFDPIWYLDKNSDLKAAFGNDYVSAYNHFVSSGISELRNSSSEYWGKYYKEHNSDLSGFSGTQLLIHYMENGRKEGRKANDTSSSSVPSQPSNPTGPSTVPQQPQTPKVQNAERFVFDYRFYADVNQDLLATFGYNESALRNHWNTFGKREGRIASPVFSVKDYIEYNSDLKATYGNNYEEAINHFIAFGVNEERRTAKWFDIKYYVDNNSDLKKAFGDNYGNAFEHFVNLGINEFRTTSSEFNVETYKNSNNDLVNAFGKDGRSYYTHYVRVGFSEGRKCI